MGDTTAIEWCDKTLNPWLGCSKVSPACKNCYAERDFDHRYGKVKWGPNGTRVLTSEANWNKPLKWNREAEKAGTRPRVFCASLADVFEDWQGPILDHNGVTQSRIEGACEVMLTMDDVRKRLFALIDATPNLDWLLLTKRPENIRRMWAYKRIEPYELLRPKDSLYSYDRFKEHDPVRKNVWLGTTCENQEYADKRIPELLKCRDLSPVLFLSIEPMLGPIDLNQSWKLHRGDGWRLNRNQYAAECPTRGIGWIIAGGESGPNARPSHPDWFRSIRDQCQAARVPFFVKQMEHNGKLQKELNQLPEDLQIREFPEVH